MTPPAKKQLPGSPEEWIIHAESDLQLARLGQQNKGVLPEQVCFHAQQAAEKAIKAVFAARRIPFPLTHYITVLIALLERENIGVTPETEDAGELTPYAVETRYPGSWGTISPQEME
jgi:HEPN domain-containing protein